MGSRFLMGSWNLGQGLDCAVPVRITPTENGRRGRDAEGQDNPPTMMMSVQRSALVRLRRMGTLREAGPCAPK
jgi:hypothetical protein